MLKRSAVVGASVWAVPIIDTVLARPASASAIPCATFNGSWMYVVYTFNGQTLFSGFSKGDTSPHCKAASNPHGSFTLACGGISYQINDFSGDPTGQITFGPASNPAANTATFVDEPNCALYVTVSGGQVSPVMAGVTIVASFCFGAHVLTGACPTGNTACAACEL
jgi:hypothetical protein